MEEMTLIEWDSIIEDTDEWGEVPAIWFTEGECHALALMLHYEYGFRLGMLADQPREVYDSGEGFVSCHAFVVLPDGRWLDIRGPRWPEDFLAAWTILDHVYDDVVASDFDTWNDPDLDLGEFWAHRLVANFLLDNATAA